MIALGLALNLENFAPSQYAGLNFNNLCVFNGEILGSGETGLMELTGDNDNSTIIEAFFQVPSTDLGIPKIKKVRSLHVSGYNKGNLIITVIFDNDEESEYVISPNGELDESSMKIDLNSNDEGKFVGLKVENVNGADFSIDTMDLLVLPTIREPATKTVAGKHKVTSPLFSSTGIANFNEVTDNNGEPTGDPDIVREIAG